MNMTYTYKLRTVTETFNRLTIVEVDVEPRYNKLSNNRLSKLQVSRVIEDTVYLYNRPMAMWHFLTL